MYSSGEYKSTILSPYSKYSDLSLYNKGSFMGPILPSTVPSMQYPTLLEQKKIQDYDVLTLQTHDTNYTTTDKAYGTSCQPKYYIGECPSNKYVRPFVPDIQFSNAVPTPPVESCSTKNSPIVEAYHSETLPPPIMDLLEKCEKIKLHIFITDPTKCPFSKKLISDLDTLFGRQNYITKMKVINITHDEKGQQLFSNVGGYGVPYFYSPITNSSHTGYQSDVMKIIESLVSVNKEGYSHPKNNHHMKTMEPSSSEQNTGFNPLIQKIKDLQLHIMVMKSCGFCDKYKTMLKNLGLMPYVKIEDIANIQDKQKLKGIRGFPFTTSGKTKKSYTGYPSSIEVLVKQLS